MPRQPSINREPRWYNCLHANRLVADPGLRAWLLDRGSLTERLIRFSGGHFRVEIISQRMEVPRPSEQQLLGITPRQPALIREVMLIGCDRPWVYARSVIPQQTLTGRLRSLRKLDNRPLGALLFSDPGMSRGPIEVAWQNSRTLPLPGPLRELRAQIPGRRSVFRLDGKPLLVCEMFLPDFPPYTPYNNRL